MKTKVKAISSLLTEVSRKAGIELNHAGLQLLSERINEEIGEDLFNQKYLYYNLLKKIEEHQAEPEESIGLNANYLHKLAQYLGYNDYFDFQQQPDIGQSDQDHQFINKEANQCQVWYAAKPFSLFNLWRNPDSGLLLRENVGLTFHGENEEIRLLKIHKAETHQMPGDSEALWIKATYKCHQQEDAIGYFANMSNPLPRLNIGPIAPLLRFFEGFADK